MNLDLHLLKNLLNGELKTCITNMLKTNKEIQPKPNKKPHKTLIPLKSTSSWFVSANESALKDIIFNIPAWTATVVFQSIFKKNLTSNHLLKTKKSTADVCIEDHNVHLPVRSTSLSEVQHEAGYKILNRNTLYNQKGACLRITMYKSGDMRKINN